MSFQGMSIAIGGIKNQIVLASNSALAKTQQARWTATILKYRVGLIGLSQALVISFSLVAAWLLRFNFSLPDRRLLLWAAPVLVVVRLMAIARFGLLHGWWRYTDIGDAVAIAKAIASGSILFVVVMRFLLGNTAFPRAVYILEPLLSTLLLAGIRVFFRVVTEVGSMGTQTRKKVILIGAGTAAEMTLREIVRGESGYCAVACLDDDRSKIGARIHGVPVLGTVDDLPQFARHLDVQDVLISVPSATGKQTKRFVEICGKAQARFKTVPSLREILDERRDVSEFRDVRLEDLLGRDPVEIDMQTVRERIEEQTVVVTGAAGTIGSELCRQVLRYSPGKLLCVDQNETGMFFLQMELSQFEPKAHLVYCVADFGDGARMKTLFAEHKPGVIFHAAAYKHVPMMETNVSGAVKNNVIGLLALLDIAEENGCPSFVLISSDKAVNPANIMGATKRVGELIVSCRPGNSMRCVSVRFGNVLGSNGSVVPVLQKQIRENRHLTITHPEVTRFFMTTNEAVSLVLEAFAIGNHGDTLVLDMGSPIRILDLAKTLIRLSGKSEPDVSIRFTGLRDGEKLCEELCYASEHFCATSSSKIRKISGTPGLWDDLNRQLSRLSASICSEGPDRIRERIGEIVPEYARPSNARSPNNGALLNTPKKTEMPGALSATLALP